MASLVDVSKIVKNYIRSVSGATDVDVVADVSGNILSRPSAQAVLTVAGLADLAANVASLTQLRDLLADEGSKSNMAASIGITVRELESILVNIVDGVGSLYGVIRRAATPSKGVVILGINEFPGDADIIIPVGTVFNATVAGTVRSIRFASTVEVTVEFANRMAFFNPDTNLFEAQVPVVAQESGSFTNVPAGAINEAINSIPGVTVIFNRVPTFGGTDVETNLQLIDRVIGAIRGQGIGTVRGYDAFVRAIPGVVDVAVVGPGNPLMTRDGGLGGAIDIYVITNDVTTTTDTFSII